MQSSSRARWLPAASAELLQAPAEMSPGVLAVTGTVRHDIGELEALDHEGLEPLALEDDYVESLTPLTAMLYKCPNVSARNRQVRLNVACPIWMRAPGEAQGVYALECAETHPQSALPWTSKALRACYEQGAERFGWSRRTPEPRSMRAGRMLVGLGMASAPMGML